jgi:hypothetical protein
MKHNERPIIFFQFGTAHSRQYFYAQPIPNSQKFHLAVLHIAQIVKK